jgi:hypothetical protein
VRKTRIMTAMICVLVAAFSFPVARATATISAPQLAWSAPQTISPRSGFPLAVSCPTRIFCMVGDQYGGYVVHRADGWHPRRALGTAAIVDLSCTANTFCMALAGGSSYLWDGTHWYGRTSVARDLRAVSCASSTFCMAIGTHSAFVWRGTRWSTATGLVGKGGWLDDVSCGAPHVCTVVGITAAGVNYAWRFEFGGWHARVRILDEPFDMVWSIACIGRNFCITISDGGFSQRFDGHRWSDVLPADEGHGFDGTRIACASTRSCIAIGSLPSVQGQHTVAAHFDGKSWQRPQSVPFAGLNNLIGCALGGPCHAISDTGYDALWDGTWHGRGFLLDPTYGELTGLACPATGRCFAVTEDLGRLASANGVWGGAHLLPSASDRSLTNTANSISCPTTTLCFAHELTGDLIRYNGTSWSRAGVVPGGAIDCPTTRFCLGYTDQGHAVIYNGTRWSIGTVRRVPDSAWDKSCVPGFCMTVTDDGRYVTYNRRAQTWTSARRIANFTTVYGPAVSCSSATFCLEVDGSGQNATWDGAAWHRIPDAGDYLSSVSCLGPTFCLAGGQGTVHVWDGTGWAANTFVLPQPTDPYDDNSLLEASCTGTAAAPTCVVLGRREVITGTVA